MNLILGLGNPEDRYHMTRHNVGFMVMDRCVEKLGGQWAKDKYTNSLVVKNKSLILAKPLTFMNNSGEAAKKLVDRYLVSTQNLFVVHDDLDLALGEYKVQFGKGPKVHKGVNSIEDFLGTAKFWRVRIGVDNRDIKNRTSGEVYVLQNFDKEEVESIEKIYPELLRDIMSTIDG